MLLFQVTNAFFVWMQIHKVILNNITFIVKKLCEEIEFSLPSYYVVFTHILNYIIKYKQIVFKTSLTKQPFQKNKNSLN